MSARRGKLWLLGMVLVAGCGAGPRPVEVTEPFTSGDEEALGIAEPSAAEAEPSDEHAPASDVGAEPAH